MRTAERGRMVGACVTWENRLADDGQDSPSFSLSAFFTATSSLLRSLILLCHSTILSPLHHPLPLQLHFIDTRSLFQPYLLHRLLLLLCLHHHRLPLQLHFIYSLSLSRHYFSFSFYSHAHAHNRKMGPPTLALSLLLPNKFCQSDPLSSRKRFPRHHTPLFFFTLRITCSTSKSKPRPQPSQSTQPLPSLPGLSLASISDWADAIKELGMQRRRPLYNHHKWVEHRSARRHVRHVASSLSSRVILSLIPPVLVFTSVAALVAAYNTAVVLRLLPEFLPLLHAPALPYQLTAPALALLLVFRTEASYSRFEEARRTWAKAISGARDLARAAAAWVSLPEDELLRDAIMRYVTAFPVALKCHVIYGSNIEQELGDLLDEGDLAVIMRAKHRPRCIIGFISQCLQLVHLDESKRNILESKVSCFDEVIGVCEELMGIPIPLSYTRLTSRFLVLWHLTLPVILWDDCNWIIVPATFMSAASLYCIEEVGVLIEEPFPALPLDELCSLACESIKESLDTEKSIQRQLQAKRKRTGSSTGCSSNGRPMSEQHPS